MAAGIPPITTEKRTATRPTTHNPNSISKGGPAIGNRPVQFGTAVSAKPETAAPTKPNSISWRCQACPSKRLGIVNSPTKTQSHKASAMTPHAWINHFVTSGASLTAAIRLVAGSSVAPAGLRILTRKTQAISSEPAGNTTSRGSLAHCQNLTVS